MRLSLLWVLLVSLAYADPFSIPTEPPPAEEPPPPERKQEIAVYAECHDIALTKTSSADSLKVEVFDSAGKADSKRVDMQKVFANALDPATCAMVQVDGSANDWGQKALIKTFVTTWNKDVRVRLTATGSDAVWVDRLRVRVAAGLTETSVKGNDYGVDGKKGWCLSTQSSDSFGSDRQDGKCKTCVEFRGDGSYGSCS